MNLSDSKKKLAFAGILFNKKKQLIFIYFIRNFSRNY